MIQDEEPCAVELEVDEADEPAQTGDTHAAAASSIVPAGVRDIDFEVRMDANYFHHYAPELYASLKRLETQYFISPTYCSDVQHDIRPKMRAVLVDWLVEVIEEYRLLPESLYSAVQYLDRYLSQRSVTRQRLQLLGCACMLIAAKFEEIYMPMAEEFVYITDNAYDRGSILEMEQEVLQVLDYSVKCATAKHFMTRYLHAAGATRGDMTTNIVKYLCELSLLEYRFLEYKPSQVTAASVLVAHRIQGISPAWTPTLQHYTGFKEAELEKCAADLSCAHRDADSLPIEAVYKKYTHSPYMRVATKAKYLPLPAGFAPRPSCTSSLSGNTY